MMLVIGTLRDMGIALLVHRLLDRDIPFLLLDPREHGSGFSLSWKVTGERMSGAIRYGEDRIDLDTISAVYVHLLDGDRHPESHGVHRASETRALLEAFLETAQVPVCNRPSCSATNFSKTYQERIIASHGFAIPRTLVTNIPESARSFFDECQGRVIYKSLSSRRSIVRRMTGHDLDRLDHLAGGPTQFQEWVPGTDFRVHVMGRRLYPTEITAEATDYRFCIREGTAPTMRGVELEEEIRRRCLSLTGELGMIAAGIDLRRSLDGRWYCFEVNPTPAFAYYEQFTGQRIADGLIDALQELAAVPAGCNTSPLAQKENKP